MHVKSSMPCLFLVLHISGEAIYTTRCGSVGKEKPKHSGLPETEATQVRSKSSTCWGEHLKAMDALSFFIGPCWVFSSFFKVPFCYPCLVRSPVLVAEFLNGERHWQSLHNYSCDEVSSGILRNRGVYYSQRIHIHAILPKITEIPADETISLLKKCAWKGGYHCF